MATSDGRGGGRVTPTYGGPAIVVLGVVLMLATAAVLAYGGVPA
jgi:hypothetical protein